MYCAGCRQGLQPSSMEGSGLLPCQNTSCIFYINLASFWPTKDALLRNTLPAPTGAPRPQVFAFVPARAAAGPNNRESGYVASNLAPITSLPASSAASGPSVIVSAKSAKIRRTGAANQQARTGTDKIPREDVTPDMMPFIKLQGTVCHISRPSNSWLLYLNDKLAEMKRSSNAPVPIKEAFKSAARDWARESEFVRARYASRAHDLAEQHKTLFPSYKFKRTKARSEVPDAA